MTGPPRITATTRPRPPAVPVGTRVPFAFVHINKCGGSSIEIALGLPKRHLSAPEMRQAIGAEEWARRYTFSVIRNPFDRVASIYYYRVRTDQTGLAGRHLSFNRWVARVWGEGDTRYMDDPRLFRPCAHWLCDEDGRPMVDDVARLETLESDWRRIAARLGVASTLPRTNRNTHPPHRAIFSDEARALVEMAFADDLGLFGYAF